jgi:hypothetical protein
MMSSGAFAKLTKLSWKKPAFRARRMKTANNAASSEVVQSWDSSLRLLTAAKRVQAQPVLAGFEGFVDTILHVVSERRSSTKYSRVSTLQAFSEKILGASGGAVT